MTLTVQFYTMISMVLGGFYLGIAMETYRRFSYLWGKRRWLVYILEISFWLSQTLILFYLLYRINNGELRVYVFLACLLGFSMYKVLGARLYKVVLEWLIHLNIKCYQYLARAIQIIIIKPIFWGASILIALIQFLFSLLFGVIRFVCLPLYWLIKGIYFILPQKIKDICTKLTAFYSIIKNTCVKCMKYLMFKRR